MFRHDDYRYFPHDANYHELLDKVLHQPIRGDRTKTGTHSLFGYQMKFNNLSYVFPILTTKRVHWHGVVAELLWMLSGSTNITPLVDQNVNIWNDWPLKHYNEAFAILRQIPPISKTGSQTATTEEFVEALKADDIFAVMWGDLGPVYGKQWRCWQSPKGEEIDQFQNLINQLRKDPESRRMIVMGWNPADIEEMAVSGLPPCHMMMQFYTRKVTHKLLRFPNRKRYLDCQVYIRSNDLFLGAPFNIAQYALITHIIAEMVGMVPGDLTYTIGDGHIYLNHVDQVREQLARTSSPEPAEGAGPQLTLGHIFDDQNNPSFDRHDLSFDDALAFFTVDKVKQGLVNYFPHAAIKAPVAV